MWLYFYYGHVLQNTVCLFVISSFFTHPFTLYIQFLPNVHSSEEVTIKNNTKDFYPWLHN